MVLAGILPLGNNSQKHESHETGNGVIALWIIYGFAFKLFSVDFVRAFRDFASTRCAGCLLTTLRGLFFMGKLCRI